MIEINEKYECCGCTACASVCSHQCITMVEDAEGFKYPKVDNEKCVGCGLCERVCPMLHPESNNKVQLVVGAKHKDDGVRKTSSSGGAFSLLAEDFISKGGIVVGCAMDENLKAKHIICRSKDELVKLRSSKYVQSDMDGVFVHVRKLLREGHKVLFSGTPCQVAGLKRFLIKTFDNLYCIDVLCHGVPSPKLFREYKEQQEKRFKSKADFVSFRSKKREWKRLYIDFLFENGKEYFKYSGYDPYMSLFLNNKSQRSSCFHCPFTTTSRQGDISLGDFWGIGKAMPKWDDDKGISMVLVNNAKGQQMFSEIKDVINAIECDINTAINGNKVLCQNISGEQRRNKFYDDYKKYGYDVAIHKNVHLDNVVKQLYYSVMRRVKDKIYSLLNKGF